MSSSALPSTYRAWVLNEYAKGPINDSTFKLKEEPMPDVQSLPPSHVLVRVTRLAMEPAMRPSVSLGKSYRDPHPLGEPMWALGLGEVVGSSDDKYPVGSKVAGRMEFRDYALIDTRVPGNVQPYDDKVGLEHLAALGPPGRAAWAGLMDTAKCKAGDVVLVSAAAGATGSAVVQIARAVGAAKVIGIASKSKCQAVRDLGADACLDYGSATFSEDLKKATEEKVSVYFDNVGGPVTDAALACMAPHGRIAVCGAIAEYQNMGDDDEANRRTGMKNFRYVLLMRLQVLGFVLPDFAPEDHGRMGQELGKLVREGKLKSEIYTFPKTGIEHAVESLEGLFTGMNRGKMTIKIAD